ncbi:MAG: (d)CMP kinase [Clostridia bacterium]|nr:(d)CMP kinase [Clostridia bacterium]
MQAGVIAIDGPAGAGKSTIAKLTAEQLGYDYIDTGAMYRAITLMASRAGVEPDDPDLGMLALNADFRFQPTPSGLVIYLNGEDVTAAIRDPIVSGRVSYYAREAAVRQALTRMQRDLAAGGNVILEGRDIGTVVLPKADKKFFITASPRERARRRQIDLRNQGFETDIDELERQIAERDRIDSTREIAPLKPAPDAVIVDTTGKTIPEVLGIIVSEVRQG